MSTSTQLLVLRNGQECFFYALMEHGDGEGRSGVGRNVRNIRASRLLKSGEQTTRLLLETRLSDLEVTRRDDPLSPSEEDELDPDTSSDPTETKASEKRWLAETRRLKPTVVLVSVALLTLATGERRAFEVDVEFGDDDARRNVATSVRQIRRVGLLEPKEKLERYLLEIALDGTGAKLRPDPVLPATARKRPRAPP